MQMIEYKIEKLLQEAEEKWAQKVKEKFHPPEGTFSEKSAEEIARIISQNWEAGLQKTMARLNFFLNRGGKNITPEIRKKVERAKDIVHDHYKKHKE
jgi:hypothetical protein